MIVIDSASLSYCVERKELRNFNSHLTSVRMKPIYTLGRQIYISLSIKRLRVRRWWWWWMQPAQEVFLPMRAGVLRAGIRRRAKRRICKQPRYTHRSPRIKRLSREAIREQLARMIHGGWRAAATEREGKGRDKTRDETGMRDEGGRGCSAGATDCIYLHHANGSNHKRSL